MRRQLITTNRNRRKVTLETPYIAGPPMVVQVEAVAGETSRIEITFTMPVLLAGLPPWPALVGGPPGTPVDPIAIVSHEWTSLVLDYGEDVSTASAVQVPVGDQSVRSYQAERVPPGSHPLA